MVEMKDLAGRETVDSIASNMTSATVVVPDHRLPISELIAQLSAWNCPQKILDDLTEWTLDLYLDRVKLKDWCEAQNENS
jgi:hypothetical protein